jgi:hypothetical protein
LICFQYGTSSFCHDSNQLPSFDVCTHHNTHLVCILGLPTVALFFVYPLVSCTFYLSSFLVFIIYLISSSAYFSFPYFALFSRIYDTLLLFFHSFFSQFCFSALCLYLKVKGLFICRSCLFRFVLRWLLDIAIRRQIRGRKNKYHCNDVTSSCCLICFSLSFLCRNLIAGTIYTVIFFFMFFLSSTIRFTYVFYASLEARYFFL